MGDLGSIPGSGRSPGERKGYPLQYSGLENSRDCIVQGVAKSWTRLSDSHFTPLLRVDGTFPSSLSSMFSFAVLAPAGATAGLESRQGRPNCTAAAHAGGTGAQVPAPPTPAMYSAPWQTGCACTGAGGAGRPSRACCLAPGLLAGAPCLQLGSVAAYAVHQTSSQRVSLSPSAPQQSVGTQGRPTRKTASSLWQN